MTASQVFHVPFDEVTPLQRSNAKAVNFGIIYGKGAFSLGQDLGISRKEAEEYINAYFARYPKIKTFMRIRLKTGRKTAMSLRSGIAAEICPNCRAAISCKGRQVNARQ